MKKPYLGEKNTDMGRFQKYNYLLENCCVREENTPGACF